MSCIKLFFEQNYDYLIEVARGRVGEDAGDLVNDLCLNYIEDEEKILPICERGELMKYICRTLAICGFSKTSRYYYKYKKSGEKIAKNYPQVLLRNSDQDVENVQDIDMELTLGGCILQEVTWFDAEVFRIYHLHNHSLQTLSNATGISKSTIYKSIQDTKTYLKENSKRIRRQRGELYEKDRDR